MKGGHSVILLNVLIAVEIPWESLGGSPRSARVDPESFSRGV